MIKAAVIVFPGTNCEHDTKRACEFFGWEVDFIWHTEIITKNYDMIFLPGGFSYGDHISSGRIAKLSNAVKSLPVGKSLIIGICNGFQILCEAKLLSGALTHNQNLKFISKQTKINFTPPPVTSNESRTTLTLPIAHHQGNFVCEKDFDKSQILMSYNHNENGSDLDIAGLYDKNNKIIAMMPHPERAVFKELESTDGRKVFKFFENQL